MNTEYHVIALYPIIHLPHTHCAHSCLHPTSMIWAEWPIYSYHLSQTTLQKKFLVTFASGECDFADINLPPWNILTSICRLSNLHTHIHTYMYMHINVTVINKKKFKHLTFVALAHSLYAKHKFLFSVNFQFHYYSLHILVLLTT